MKALQRHVSASSRCLAIAMVWLLLCGSLTTLCAAAVEERQYLQFGLGTNSFTGDGRDTLRQARSPQLVDSNGNTFGDHESIDLAGGRHFFVDVQGWEKFSLGYRYLSAIDKRTSSWGHDRRVQLMGVSARDAEYRQQVLVISRYATGTYWIPLGDKQRPSVGLMGGLGLVNYEYRQSVARPQEDNSFICDIFPLMCTATRYDVLASDSSQVRSLGYLAGAFVDIGTVFGVRAGANLMHSDLPRLKSEGPQGGSRSDTVSGPMLDLYVSLRVFL